ncbi:MAG: thiol:disulfide interchange protein DsbA/DsbL [Gammaproteobacteria bacterium]|nr:thiol:disulfide interchange protein DsbA/DsbL [Gammaproteobacteria bacterium]
MSSTQSKTSIIPVLIVIIVVGLLAIILTPDEKSKSINKPDTTLASEQAVKAIDEPQSNTSAPKGNTFEEGLDYVTRFPDGVSEEPILLEFFSYMCAHCYNFEPTLSRWLMQKPDSVRLIKVPVSFGRTGLWGFAVKAYYIAEELNVAEPFSRLIFRQIHIENNPPRQESDLFPIFQSLGVNTNAFKVAASSENVASKVTQAEMLTKKYKVSGVPYFLINNKYESGPRSFESEQSLFNLWNKLPGKDF